MCNQGATSSKVQKVHLIVMLQHQACRTKWELQLCKEAKKKKKKKKKNVFLYWSAEDGLRSCSLRKEAAL